MKITVGITGASGSVYGIRLIEVLHSFNIDLFVITSEVGFKVCLYETGINLNNFLSKMKIKYYNVNNLFAPSSSGSYRQDAVIIMPCTVGTLARIANGVSNNLLERTADVALKERFKLILAIRETPLNNIHIENMLKCSRAGAIISPITTAFYTKHTTVDEIVDFQVGKVLDLLNLEHNLFLRWAAKNK